MPLSASPIPWDKKVEFFHSGPDLQVARAHMLLRDAVEHFLYLPPEEQDRCGIGLHEAIVRTMDSQPTALGFLRPNADPKAGGTALARFQAARVDDVESAAHADHAHAPPDQPLDFYEQRGTHDPHLAAAHHQNQPRSIAQQRSGHIDSCSMGHIGSLSPEANASPHVERRIFSVISRPQRSEAIADQSNTGLCPRRA
jgi:hypothetical protein